MIYTMIQTVTIIIMMKNCITYCHRILPRVSRTFALGIDLLQEPLRDTVCVAYLICRILDTIEDTTILPADRRAALLERAGRDLFAEELWAECSREIRDTFPERDFHEPDHDLCRNCHAVLTAFHDLPAPFREVISVPAGEMARGMAATVRRETGDEGLRLETLDDLRQYCYYVAGTVGNMLTGLFSLDRVSISGAPEAALRRHGVDFGLGLQLTNIIKGVTDDMARGVSYLPRQLLRRAGVTLEELIRQPGDPRGRRMIGELVTLALTWLDSALEYTTAIPEREEDIRLFCALPLIFAVRTLALAGRTEYVFGGTTLKISRDEVTEIYQRLQVISRDDNALRELYEAETQSARNTINEFPRPGDTHGGYKV